MVAMSNGLFLTVWRKADSAFFPSGRDNPENNFFHLTHLTSYGSFFTFSIRLCHLSGEEDILENHTIARRGLGVWVALLPRLNHRVVDRSFMVFSWILVVGISWIFSGGHTGRI